MTADSRASVIKLADAHSYDAYATTYGRHIETLAAPLAAEVCRLALLRRGDRVLDVGCGTGLATRHAARSVGPSGVVSGVDLSEGMIRAATSFPRAQGAPQARYVVMDAETLAVRDRSQEAVISLCAVLHFPDIGTALAEMFRTLVPGGRLAVAIGSRPTSLVAAAQRVGARTVSAIRRDPQMRAPGALLSLIPSHVRVPSEVSPTDWGGSRPHKRLVDEIAKAGFVEISTAWVGTETRFDSAHEFWSAQSSIVTEVRKRLPVLDPDAVESLRRRFVAAAQATLDKGGSLVYPYGAFFVAAKRPGPIDQDD